MVGSDQIDNQIETTLPATAASAAVARQFVAAAIRRFGLDTEFVETAQLLVSELVTNTIVHTTSDVRVRVIVRADGLRIEVWDHDVRAPHVRTVEPHATGGRGLGIVDRIADAWGSDPLDGGKSVWFELAR